jgi:hypothetical protein
MLKRLRLKRIDRGFDQRATLCCILIHGRRRPATFTQRPRPALNPRRTGGLVHSSKDALPRLRHGIEACRKQPARDEGSRLAGIPIPTGVTHRGLCHTSMSQPVPSGNQSPPSTVAPASFSGLPASFSRLAGCYPSPSSAARGVTAICVDATLS